MGRGRRPALLIKLGELVHPKAKGAELACQHLFNQWQKLTPGRNPSFRKFGQAGKYANAILCKGCADPYREFVLYRSLGELTPAERERQKMMLVRFARRTAKS